MVQNIKRREVNSSKKPLFVLITVIITLGLIFVIGETAVRLFRPFPYQYPRYKYLPDYGFGLYPNTRIVHGKPGVFKYYYTVNENGHRGRAIPIKQTYEKPNIVVLGDSFTFGQGVNDGQDYATVLRDSLDGCYEVLNLGTPGWGLTQEIRRYFEFGRLYNPTYVVLQYSRNDPTDNIQNLVTVLEDGEFKFIPSASSVDRFKRYLSHSIIQKSQLYNFFKVKVFNFIQSRQISNRESHLKASDGDDGPLPRHLFYCELLEQFAGELRREGVTLIMISVQKQLYAIPHIGECVQDLNARGELIYLDLEEHFRPAHGSEGMISPEGHWGWRAHRIIGTALAEFIKKRGIN